MFPKRPKADFAKRAKQLQVGIQAALTLPPTERQTRHAALADTMQELLDSVQNGAAP